MARRAEALPLCAGLRKRPHRTVAVSECEWPALATAIENGQRHWLDRSIWFASIDVDGCCGDPGDCDACVTRGGAS